MAKSNRWVLDEEEEALVMRVAVGLLPAYDFDLTKAFEHAVLARLALVRSYLPTADRPYGRQIYENDRTSLFLARVDGSWVLQGFEEE